MGAAGLGGSKLMVAVSADETLMLNLYFIFLICCHKTVFEICLHIISFITELRQALVREKKNGLATSELCVVSQLGA